MINLRELPGNRVSSVAELSELVCRAAATDQAVYPRGGGTMQDFGLPPAKPGIAVDLTGLVQVIDYPARDMTITVQAGITIARLQEILAAENQRLPIDVSLPEQATLGGAIACNVSGPRRYGFGTFRDYVIGISVVNDRGQEVKAGGRVVKNVAGYDLCKLYTGSLGTLGIITQVTLKVRPRPGAQAMLMARCPGESLPDLLNGLHDSATRPVCIDILDAGGNDDPQVFVGFEDSAEAVEWQVERLQAELGPRCSWTESREESADALFCRLTEAQLLPEHRLTCRVSLPPNDVAEFLLKARGFPLAVRHGHAGNGILTGHFREPVIREEASKVTQQLRALAVAAGGSLVLTRCPEEWKAELGVWGEPRGDWELMRNIKRQLDPLNVFNPGRFVGGI